MRPGYAIEYDCLDPTQLTLSLETKKISGLFLQDNLMGQVDMKKRQRRD